MATMQDIADRVGVHRVTVSNVLNGKLKFGRSDAFARAAEIRRVAMEMGFRPSSAAKATRTGRTGFVGMIRSPLLAYSVHNPAFDMGIDEALHERGLCLVRDIIDHAARPEDVTVPRIVRENSVDGLIINYVMGTPPLIREVLDRCRVPAIWINRKRDHNCVHPADEGAAFDATVHLLQHGHKDVLFLGATLRTAKNPHEPHYSSIDRQVGYARAMTDAGLTPRVRNEPAPTHVGVAGEGDMLTFFLEQLSASDRPSAVLCGAGGGREMLYAASLLKLRVPQDLSVMTFDDEAAADHKVRVDRVLGPNASMGTTAISELCALIDAPDEPRKPVVLPFEFHITGTVGRL